jgi:hypothetical protein
MGETENTVKGYQNIIIIQYIDVDYCLIQVANLALLCAAQNPEVWVLLWRQVTTHCTKPGASYGYKLSNGTSFIIHYVPYIRRN